MNKEEYLQGLRREQARREQLRRDDALLHDANVSDLTQQYKASQGGGHGGAIAGVVILLVLGIAAWAYLV